MFPEIAVLILSIAIGLPLVAVAGRALVDAIRRMNRISTMSAWVGRVAAGVGLAASALSGLAVISTGNPFYGPLSGLGSALLVELVFSQLRNGTRAWERRERIKGLAGTSAATIEIQRMLPLAPRILTMGTLAGVVWHYYFARKSSHSEHSFKRDDGKRPEYDQQFEYRVKWSLAIGVLVGVFIDSRPAMRGSSRLPSGSRRSGHHLLRTVDSART
ncbi:MAG: hypothetical protein HYX50_03685 [Chloroflexi bacterium]|nr:hypothetical protein [Chloroflexota bacterium]